MSKLTYQSLSDCVRSLSGGTPSKSNDSFWSGDLPWVSSGEMGQSRITDTELHITQEAGENHSKIVPAGTVLVVVRGMSLAKEFRVSITQREMAFNQDLKALIAKENVNSLFLFYSLYGRRFEICKLASESAHGTKKLDTKVLDSIPVFLPAIPTQKKIAAIVSAYDDLIENNDRRIALLEKMAEEIYREWFVRLRFPGFDRATFHKGIPEGWEIRPFSQVASINPFERIDKNEPRPYVGMDNLSLSSMFFTYEEYRIGSAGSKFRNDDTLFPRITPSLENGKKGYVMSLNDGQVAIGSTEFIVMREKILTSEYIYFLTCLPEFRKHAEQSMIGASGRQRVQEGCFDCFIVKTPPKDLMDHFSAVVKPLFFKIKVSFDANKILKQTRDRLLTRLISGKLSVEDLDIQFPPSMTTDP
jgi:type I restriction enzyme, S subunit